jgi:hypothetical protein
MRGNSLANILHEPPHCHRLRGAECRSRVDKDPYRSGAIGKLTLDRRE